jgi:hypothetical protein
LPTEAFVIDTTVALPYEEDVFVAEATVAVAGHETFAGQGIHEVFVVTRSHLNPPGGRFNSGSYHPAIVREMVIGLKLVIFA